MKILSIETSCDETAIAVVECEGGLSSPHFTILGHELFSQIDIHREFGGVFPMVAKREHAKKLPFLLQKLLNSTGIIEHAHIEIDDEKWKQVKDALVREEGLFELLQETGVALRRPNIDLINVTYGPGLEPALWVGISFAKALGLLWDIPVRGVNHMEGHIVSVLASSTDTVTFPTLSVLISGGHTELVYSQKWGDYKVIGRTRDDAVGEAFDKVARMLQLPYPGGPEVSKLAQKARLEEISGKAHLPRPMLHSDNLDFSFSGLKTAVLYYLRDHADMSDLDRADLCREFEDAVTEVLLHKTKQALQEFPTNTIIVAGGVIANTYIRESFKKLEGEFPYISVHIPDKLLATDNAIMIACAGYIDHLAHPEKQTELIAKGNLTW